MPRPPNIPVRQRPNINPNTINLGKLFQEGYSFHQNGGFDKALVIYEKILRMEENHLDVLQLKGSLLLQMGRYVEAVEPLAKATKINQSHAHLFYNLGCALSLIERLNEAVDNFKKAILIKPNYPEAYFNLGNTLQSLSLFDEAQENYKMAIKLNPNYPDAQNNLGLLLDKGNLVDLALNHFNKAIDLKINNAIFHNNRAKILYRRDFFHEAMLDFQKAIAINPSYSEAYSNLGNALNKIGRLEDALVQYTKAIELDPSNASSYSNRGATFITLEQIDHAKSDIEKALELDQNHVDALSNYGIVLKDLRLFDAALSFFEKAIAIKPDFAEAYNNRGLVLQKLNRLDEALISFDNAISLKPDFAEAYNNKGGTLLVLFQLSEAIICVQKAIELKSEYYDAFINLASIFNELHDDSQAISYYEKASELEPNNPLSSFNYGVFKLSRGDFKAGWKGYESRWNADKDNFQYKFKSSQPYWLGQNSLTGKTIILYYEQGLGDTIQFCRYASMVAKLGAEVILIVQPQLEELLKNLEGVSQVISENKIDALPVHDYFSSLASLPLAFNTLINTVPNFTPYIDVNDTKVNEWSLRLGAKSAPRIGLVWSSFSAFQFDRKRSMTLSQLLNALPQTGFEYICLQKEIKSEEMDILKKSRISFYGNELNDFTDTASLISNLDLVISTCTSVPHLAGALGKKTWMMLSHVPDWRWLLDRNDSPWYPSMKLFRQRQRDDWSGLTDEIRANLIKEFYSSDTK
jgi:tetratricopeptide (TPR) repeat protein